MEGAVSNTYTKLKTGAWGIRGQGSPPKVGSRVDVIKKSGERRTETVIQIVYADNGTWIAAFGDARNAPHPATVTNARYRGRSTGCSCGSREDANGALINPERACRQCRYDDQ